MSVLTLNSENFEETIKSGKPVIVDFFATWCGPCKMYAPMYSEIAERNPDIIFAQLDIDESSEIATKYFVQSVPTLISFKDGEQIKMHQGGLPEDELLNLVKKD